MKLGIDISQIVYKGTGVSRFTEGLVHAICDYDTKNHWTFFFSSLRQTLDKHILEKIETRKHTLISLPIPPTFLSLMWNSLHRVSIEKFTGELDWFITSDWTEAPSTAKKATIVHDLVFMRYPETVDNLILSTQQKRLNWVKKESELIFADSQATKNDLVDLMNVSSDKVVTIYPGVDTITATAAQKISIKNKYNLVNPFILCVGKIEPRKNLDALIQAYNGLQLKNVDLVVVGASGWGKLQAPTNPQIHFLGFVDDDELAALYASCQFFIFPSIWEGFGYPAVEAMKAGAATAVSNTSSLQEIGENASYFFDPHSVESIQEALTELSTNAGLREELIEKGRKKSLQYTWKNYFDTFIDTLEKRK